MRRKRKVKSLLQIYRKSKRSSVLVHFVLRTLVILCMIFQLIRGDLNNAFLCLLSLILFTLPVFVQIRFKIKLPRLLETIIYLFIFAAEILGEIYNFYGNVPNWDTMLHTINGFICAGIGFALVELLNENSKKINLSPLYMGLVAFCFSMTVGVCWEFIEYAADNVLSTDMQKDTVVQSISSVELNSENKNVAVKIQEIERTVLYDAEGNEIAVIEGGYLDIGLHDTMKDMLVNLIGAVVFSFFGFFYEKNREKYKFAGNFIPTKNVDVPHLEGDI